MSSSNPTRLCRVSVKQNDGMSARGADVTLIPLPLPHGQTLFTQLQLYHSHIEIAQSSLLCYVNLSRSQYHHLEATHFRTKFRIFTERVCECESQGGCGCEFKRDCEHEFEGSAKGDASNPLMMDLLKSQSQKLSIDSTRLDSTRCEATPAERLVCPSTTCPEPISTLPPQSVVSLVFSCMRSSSNCRVAQHCM